MATDAQLTVALSANITNLTKALKRAGVELDGFEKDVDRKTKSAARKVSDNLAKAANDNGALRLDQWSNLSYQVNDVVSGLAMGQRPMQILTQQGGQFYQILAGANGGVTGALKEIATRAIGLATPFNLAAGAVLGVGTAAYLLGTRWTDAQSKIEQGLTGIGRISGATVRDINDIAQAASAAGKMTLGTARDIATALAATGKIGKGQIGAVTGLAPGYAKLLGVDVTEAGNQLAKIFSDPSKGADEMNARLGSLDDRTRQYKQPRARSEL